MIEIKVSGQDINELKLNLFAATQAFFNGDFNEPGKSRIDFGFKREFEREITETATDNTPAQVEETSNVVEKETASFDKPKSATKSSTRKPNKKAASGESKSKAEVKGELKVPVEKLVEKEDVYVEPEEHLSTNEVASNTNNQVTYDQPTITAILQKVVAAHGMRAAKTIINSYGATRIGELPQDKYEDFANKCLSKLQEPVSEDRFATK